MQICKFWEIHWAGTGTSEILPLLAKLPLFITSVMKWAVVFSELDLKLFGLFFLHLKTKLTVLCHYWLVAITCY